MMQEQWEEMENELHAELDRELENSLRQMDDEIGRAIQKQLDDQLDEQLARQMDAERAALDDDDIGWTMEQHLLYADEEDYRDGGEHLVKSHHKSPVTVAMLNEQIQKIVDRFKSEPTLSKVEL
mmetsp:Transcript_2424/g.3240  ORF Transcript_2424/g.3240 Transcript_2424/m.3240 type:complete len:124 (+) Transcript_2424:282-653(+)